MLRDDVFQCLLDAGMPYSKIEKLLADALEYGEADSVYGFRLINTNSGMPAEFRIERI